MAAARIYQEIIDRHRPPPVPRTLLFWKSPAEIPLDLSGFFNNDGVASADDPSDANFDCPDHPPHLPGSGYPGERLPPSGAVLALERAGGTFLFPVIAPGEVNNIACRGQRLAAPSEDGWVREGETCTAVLFLGAAENGAANGFVTLEYADGSEQKRKLSFPDWCVKQGPEELIAVASPYRYTPGGRSRKNVKQRIDCFLYVRRIPADPARRLTGIVLPETPNLHLFALTLRIDPPSRAVALRGEALARKYHKAALLAEAPPADLTRPVAELARALDAAEKTLDPRFRRQLVWLRTQYQYLTWRIGGTVVRTGSTTEQWARKTAAGIRADLDALLAGRDPFRLRRGHLLKGYVSDIDGRIQPYAVYVPETYRPDRPAPLVVHLHGHGWYRPFQGIPTLPFRDAVVVGPHGRGSMDYMFIAEEDVLACIEEVRKDYRIDPRRVYLLGHSMGGTGCWSLATKYPDLFAAIGPSAANADSGAWTRVAGPTTPDRGAYAWLRKFLRASLDPVTYAGNLLHVPAYFLHGDRDNVVPVENSRSMARALRAAGCEFVYREGKGGGHGWAPRDVVAAQQDFLFSKRRDARPRATLRLRAACLKYGRVGWFRLLAFSRRAVFADVRAEAYDDTIALDLRHVAAFEIDLRRCPKCAVTGRALKVLVNGRPVWTALPPPNGRLRLARSGLRWRPVEELPELRKRPYLEGPVADAFTRSFLLVIGTGAPAGLDRTILRREAERFAADWELLYTKPPRVKTDREVTAEDIARHNLILYGGPGDNAVTRRIADRLPIRFRRGAVHVNGRVYSGPGVAAKFCCPNPLNPERLVVVIAGAKRARDVFQSNNLFGNWFRWGPYDNRAWFDYAVFDRRTHSMETCLEFGFFGDDWGFHRETSWFGDPKEREAAPVRRIPVLTAPPDRKVVFLSSLLPVSIRQHKLPVGFDTSARGRVLSVGRKGSGTYREFRRGLGVRAPSKITFRVNAAGASSAERCVRFRATVGVDLEGETRVAPWRRRSEWVVFAVYGDDRLLYRTARLRWDSMPVDVDVPIDGVRWLRLEVWCAGQRWLVGSAAWGNARIMCAEAAAPAKRGTSAPATGGSGRSRRNS